MTRTEFEAMYLLLFPDLARSLVRAGYQDGPDAMQTVVRRIDGIRGRTVEPDAAYPALDQRAACPGIGV